MLKRIWRGEFGGWVTAWLVFNLLSRFSTWSILRWIDDHYVLSLGIYYYPLTSPGPLLWTLALPMTVGAAFCLKGWYTLLKISTMALIIMVVLWYITGNMIW
jgi:hypothetical protein